MSLGFLDHMRVVPDHRIAGMVTYPLTKCCWRRWPASYAGRASGRAWKSLRRGRWTGCVGICRSRQTSLQVNDLGSRPGGCSAPRFSIVVPSFDQGARCVTRSAPGPARRLGAKQRQNRRR